jgi:hypothetical protein
VSGDTLLTELQADWSLMTPHVLKQAVYQIRTAGFAGFCCSKVHGLHNKLVAVSPGPFVVQTPACSSLPHSFCLTVRMCAHTEAARARACTFWLLLMKCTPTLVQCALNPQAAAHTAHVFLNGSCSSLVNIISGLYFISGLSISAKLSLCCVAIARWGGEIPYGAGGLLDLSFYMANPQVVGNASLQVTAAPKIHSLNPGMQVGRAYAC